MRPRLRVEYGRRTRAPRFFCILHQVDSHILSRGGKTKRSRLLCQHGYRMGAGGALGVVNSLSRRGVNEIEGMGPFFPEFLVRGVSPK